MSPVFDWGWRGEIAHYIHKLGYLFYPSESHNIIIRDADGTEFFSVAFEGGFVASGPPGNSSYTLHCQHVKGNEEFDEAEEFEL